MMVVYNALSCRRELSSNVYERPSSTGRVEPGLAQGDGLEQLGLLFLDQQDLLKISEDSQLTKYEAYLLRHLIASLGHVCTFIHSLDEIALNSSSVLLTLQSLVHLYCHGNVCVLRTVFVDT